MSVPSPAERLLVGDGDWPAVRLVVAGSLLLLAGVVVRPSLGAHLATVPIAVAPWTAIAYSLLPALVASRAGLLGAWWTVYPAAVAVFVGTYAGSGFVVLPYGVVPTALLAGALPALVWGTLGYLAGTAVRAVAGGARRRGRPARNE